MFLGLIWKGDFVTLAGMNGVHGLSGFFQVKGKLKLSPVGVIGFDQFIPSHAGDVARLRAERQANCLTLIEGLNPARNVPVVIVPSRPRAEVSITIKRSSHSN
ncbi:MAG: hypothetical protein CME93_01060 [Hyphomonadaceae bacterium]|nr:hypothetical protein [Hyphomonadaceae bacterium]OUX95700.1 MAG: hypothetical protein CBB77_00800 [Hyphomonas sp. TMED17]